MAKERGGLDYKIIFVADTSDAEKAKESVRAVKKEIDRLTKTKEKATAAAKQFALSQTELGREVQKLNAVTKSQITNAQKQGRITAQEAKNQRIIVAALREKRAAILQLRSVEKQLGVQRRTLHVKEIREKTIELAVQRRITKATLDTAVAQRLAAQGRDKRGLTAADRTAQGLDRQARSLRRVGREAKTTEGHINRISFTFRRLFGILAAFAAAREGLRLIRLTFSTAVRFSGELETAALGIASIIAAAGDVRGVTGTSADAITQFTLAQIESRKQLKALRQDALLTSATLEQLAFAFQTATGPGLQAGFNLDEIRQFTLRISQAATAIGLEQNQLAEEIRSILTGTIRARTTRIATALGITNADIKQAKELGNLVEFLEERFEAFGIAGKEALNTLGPLFTNAGIAIKGLLAEAAPEFFEEIKNALKDIQDIIAPLQTGGVRIINPEAIVFAKAIFDSVAGAVTQARQLVRALDFKELTEITTFIGNIISGVATFIKTITSGFISGLSTVSKILNTIISTLNSIGILEIINIENIALALAQLTRIVTIILSIKAVTFTLTAAWKALAATWVVVTTAITAVRKGMTALVLLSALWSFALSPIVLAVAAIVGALSLVALSFDSVRSTVKTIASDIGNFISDLLGFGLGDINKDLGDSVKKSRQLTTALDGVNASVISIRREFELTQDIVDKLEKALRKSADELDFARITQGASGLLSNILKELTSANTQITNETLKMSRERDLITDSILQSEKEIADQQIARLTFSQGFNASIDKYKNSLLSIGTITENIRKIEDTLRKNRIALSKAVDKGNKSERDSLNIKIGQLERERRIFLQNLKDQERLATLAEGAGPQESRAKRIAEAELAEQASKLQLLNKELDANRDIAVIESARRIEAIRGAAAIAINRLPQLINENILLKSNIEIRRLELQEVTALRNEEKQLLKLRAEASDISANISVLNNLEKANKDTSEVLTQQLTTLRDQLQQNLLITKSTEEKTRLTQLITALTIDLIEVEDARLQLEKNITLEKQEQILLEQRRALEESRALEERDSPISTGFKRAFEELITVAKTSFQLVRDTIVNITVGAAGAISNALTDALMIDGAPIEEHFSRLFRSIGNEIVRQLILAGVLKFISSLIPTGGGGGALLLEGGSNPFLGTNVAHSGLHIPKKGKASLAHYTRGVGLKEGGPPPGVHPSDTVPIWAQAGEFMMRVAAVGKYGLGVMSAINQGLINPVALQSLVSQRNKPPLSTRLVPSFASGGGVPDSAPSPRSGVLVAALPATQQTVEDLLANNGGGKAMERWLLEKGFSNQPNERDTNFSR